MKNFKLLFLIASSIFVHNMQSAEKNPSVRDKLNYIKKTFTNWPDKSQANAEKEIDKLYNFIKNYDERTNESLKLSKIGKFFDTYESWQAYTSLKNQLQKLEELFNSARFMTPEHAGVAIEFRPINHQFLELEKNIIDRKDHFAAPTDIEQWTKELAIERNKYKNKLSEIQQSLKEFEKKYPNF
ncbi:MAG: hypothetical protein P4L22_05310 [Candidatus Babeliales bacterium]|nr:hypothetical protein [Candidatus Babeliales bacterium]